jgi:hypothetical protein
MACPSPDDPAFPTGNEAASGDRPDWIGHWRVRRWDGSVPSVPTYYVATTDSWDVVKRDAGRTPHIAAHPILEIDGQMIVLKDEGTPDERSERWRVEVDGQTLRVTALTGPHEGAVGVAERTDTDPRQAGPDDTGGDGR